LTEATAAREALWTVIRGLKEEERTLYLMVEQDLMPMEEVGEVMDLPLGTVKSRLYRVREKMIKKLKAGGWYEG
jgi:RNA polymerase sigma-70 factor (ECF subfamily)